jgi:hypothetical protein
MASNPQPDGGDQNEGARGELSYSASLGRQEEAHKLFVRNYVNTATVGVRAHTLQLGPFCKGEDMKRILLHPSKVVLVLVALIIGVSVAAVFAASPHYKRGSPQCSASGTTGTCSGSIAGLGNADVKITVSVTGTAQPFCAAPGNPGNVVPGQNPVDFTASASQIVSADDIKNGNLTFSVSATAVDYESHAHYRTAAGHRARRPHADVYLLTARVRRR